MTPRAVGLLAFPIALVAWLASLQLFVAPRDVAAARRDTGDALLARQLALIEGAADRDAAIDRMRRANEEWDFMGRTFVVLALANDALSSDAGPERRERDLRAIDAAITETLALEAEHGPNFFLLPYAEHHPFVQQPARSVFVDGEIAMMLAARQAVAPRPEWEEPLRERVELLVSRFEASPAMLLESYPDEGWTFCNAIAIAAIRVSDAATGDDHTALIDAWLASARARLIDDETGMLISSFHYDGRPLDGPEGSSIFLSAQMLSVVDPEFARDQYARARASLTHELWGFAWASEWPASWRGPPDIDSGPIVPLVDASAGSSGMAILGAAAAGDHALLGGLFASLELAGFPVREGDGLRYAASNQVGDAVLLYAMVEGPLFERVRADRARDGMEARR